MDLNTVGSLVAFGLAFLKLLEFFRDRKPTLAVVAMLRGIADVGNDLILTNSSKVPASIYYFELVWAKRSPLGKDIALGRKELRTEFTLEDGPCNITVDGYSTYLLNFSNEHHFDWGTDDLYIKLSLVGREKPLWIWVVGPR